MPPNLFQESHRVVRSAYRFYATQSSNPSASSFTGSSPHAYHAGTYRPEDTFRKPVSKSLTPTTPDKGEGTHPTLDPYIRVKPNVPSVPPFPNATEALYRHTSLLSPDKATDLSWPWLARTRETNHSSDESICTNEDVTRADLDNLTLPLSAWLDNFHPSHVLSNPLQYHSLVHHLCSEGKTNVKNTSELRSEVTNVLEVGSKQKKSIDPDQGKAFVRVIQEIQTVLPSKLRASEEKQHKRNAVLEHSFHHYSLQFSRTLIHVWDKAREITKEGNVFEESILGELASEDKQGMESVLSYETFTQLTQSICFRNMRVGEAASAWLSELTSSGHSERFGENVSHRLRKLGTIYEQSMIYRILLTSLAEEWVCMTFYELQQSEGVAPLFKEFLSNLAEEAPLLLYNESLRAKWETLTEGEARNVHGMYRTTGLNTAIPFSEIRCAKRTAYCFILMLQAIRSSQMLHYSPQCFALSPNNGLSEIISKSIVPLPSGKLHPPAALQMQETEKAMTNAQFTTLDKKSDFSRFLDSVLRKSSILDLSVVAHELLAPLLDFRDNSKMKTLLTFLEFYGASQTDRTETTPFDKSSFAIFCNHRLLSALRYLLTFMTFEHPQSYSHDVTLTVDGSSGNEKQVFRLRVPPEWNDSSELNKMGQDISTSDWVYPVTDPYMHENSPLRFIEITLLHERALLRSMLCKALALNPMLAHHVVDIFELRGVNIMSFKITEPQSGGNVSSNMTEIQKENLEHLALIPDAPSWADEGQDTTLSSPGADIAQQRLRAFLSLDKADHWNNCIMRLLPHLLASKKVLNALLSLQHGTNWEELQREFSPHSARGSAHSPFSRLSYKDAGIRDLKDSAQRGNQTNEEQVCKRLLRSLSLYRELYQKRYEMRKDAEDVAKKWLSMFRSSDYSYFLRDAVASISVTGGPPANSGAHPTGGITKSITHYTQPNASNRKHQNSANMSSTFADELRQFVTHLATHCNHEKEAVSSLCRRHCAFLTHFSILRPILDGWVKEEYPKWDFFHQWGELIDQRLQFALKECGTIVRSYEDKESSQAAHELQSKSSTKSGKRMARRNFMESIVSDKDDYSQCFVDLSVLLKDDSFVKEGDLQDHFEELRRGATHSSTALLLRNLREINISGKLYHVRERCSDAEFVVQSRTAGTMALLLSSWYDARLALLSLARDIYFRCTIVPNRLTALLEQSMRQRVGPVGLSSSEHNLPLEVGHCTYHDMNTFRKYDLAGSYQRYVDIQNRNVSLRARVCDLRAFSHTYGGRPLLDLQGERRLRSIAGDRVTGGILKIDSDRYEGYVDNWEYGSAQVSRVLSEAKKTDLGPEYVPTVEVPVRRPSGRHKLMNSTVDWDRVERASEKYYKAYTALKKTGTVYVSPMMTWLHYKKATTRRGTGRN